MLCWGSNEFNVLGIGVQYTFADQFPDPVVAVALASEPCPVVVKILSINCTSDACPQSLTVITITGDEFRTGGIAGATDMRFTLDGAFREDGSIILGAEVLATNLVEPSPVAGEWTLLNVVADAGSHDVKGMWDVSDSTTYMTFRVAIDERCGFPASQGGSKPIAIDAAENTTCVATANGMAKCWGAASLQDFGPEGLAAGFIPAGDTYDTYVDTDDVVGTVGNFYGDFIRRRDLEKSSTRRRSAVETLQNYDAIVETGHYLAIAPVIGGASGRGEFLPNYPGWDDVDDCLFFLENATPRIPQLERLDLKFAQPDNTRSETYASPCLNGGACWDTGRDFACECTAAWTGVDCAIALSTQTTGKFCDFDTACASGRTCDATSKCRRAYGDACSTTDPCGSGFVCGAATGVCECATNSVFSETTLACVETFAPWFGEACSTADATPCQGDFVCAMSTLPCVDEEGTGPSQCCACAPGSRYSTSTSACTDIACTTTSCSDGVATCEEVVGSPNRCRCKPGYSIDGVKNPTDAQSYYLQGDGRACSKIDYCVGNPCGVGGTCLSKTSGYECTACPSGSVASADKQACVDVVCSGTFCAGANEVCVEVVGAVNTCACAEGFVRDAAAGGCVTAPTPTPTQPPVVEGDIDWGAVTNTCCPPTEAVAYLIQCQDESQPVPTNCCSPGAIPPVDPGSVVCRFMTGGPISDETRRAWLERGVVLEGSTTRAATSTGRRRLQAATGGSAAVDFAPLTAADFVGDREVRVRPLFAGLAVDAGVTFRAAPSALDALAREPWYAEAKPGKAFVIDIDTRGPATKWIAEAKTFSCDAAVELQLDFGEPTNLPRTANGFAEYLLVGENVSQVNVTAIDSTGARARLSIRAEAEGPVKVGFGPSPSDDALDANGVPYPEASRRGARRRGAGPPPLLPLPGLTPRPIPSRRSPTCRATSHVRSRGLACAVITRRPRRLRPRRSRQRRRQRSAPRRRPPRGAAPPRRCRRARPRRGRRPSRAWPAAWGGSRRWATCFPLGPATRSRTWPTRRASSSLSTLRVP